MATKTVYSAEQYSLLYLHKSLRVYIKKNVRGKGFETNPYWTFGVPDNVSVSGQLIGVVAATIATCLSQSGKVHRDEFAAILSVRIVSAGIPWNRKAQLPQKPILVFDLYETLLASKKGTVKESTLKSKIEGLLRSKMKRFFELPLSPETFGQVCSSLNYNPTDKKYLLHALRDTLALLPEGVENDTLKAIVKKELSLVAKKKRKAPVGDWGKFSYSEDEVSVILSFLEKALRERPINRLALFFFVGFKTGMRIGELVGLQCWQFSCLRKELLISQQWNRVTGKISDTKTGVTRVVKVDGQLYDYLFWSNTGRATNTKDSFIFGSDTSPPKTSQLCSYWSSLIQLIRVSGYPDFPLYKMSAFRHSFVTNMLKRGVDPLVVAKAVGHSPRIASLHYRDFSSTEILSVE